MTTLRSTLATSGHPTSCMASKHLAKTLIDFRSQGLGDARRFRDAVMSAKAAREQSIAGSG
eukprot:CAMPEP_0182910974 /NCGR_PEP_ID=MMETSP0034_2-20130328/36643_1 /TAXON_ID=156128 /ORGANISM="Nephroselmis pyriformis, Strain CCMP717" /LENGTH=60 /DNA_ID=CAMNT_0025047413 /DNA_START=219 /DNA_END=398 /DNA_ORIENTATION=+